MIKLNDYLVDFPVPEGVPATKLSHKEFVDILEDKVLLQWKLQFKKEGFYSSSVTLKEFVDTYVRLEEAEMYKLLTKMIAHAKKDHGETSRDRRGKHHVMSELFHKRHNRPGEHQAGKCKK
eukprot:160494-Ditylum_brightwellii.AAC.1